MNHSSFDKVEHLKLIQSVVTRMAGNSAQMKSWAVSLVTAICVFSGLSDNPNWIICFGGFVAVIAFWWMDARYLHLERCYIELYEVAAAGEVVKPFDLNYHSYVSEVDSIWKIAWSWSVVTFYGSLFAVVSILLLILINFV